MPARLVTKAGLAEKIHWPQQGVEWSDGQNVGVWGDSQTFKCHLWTTRTIFWIRCSSFYMKSRGELIARALCLSCDGFTWAKLCSIYVSQSGGWRVSRHTSTLANACKHLPWPADLQICNWDLCLHDWGEFAGFTHWNSSLVLSSSCQLHCLPKMKDSSLTWGTSVQKAARTQTPHGCSNLTEKRGPQQSFSFAPHAF